MVTWAVVTVVSVILCPSDLGRFGTPTIRLEPVCRQASPPDPGRFGTTLGRPWCYDRGVPSSEEVSNGGTEG